MLAVFLGYLESPMNPALLRRAIALVSLAPLTAFATNGMNLEGYGPVALGLGGAALAYDNGTAAVINNPATLGLMASRQQLDVALGFLGPDVSAIHAASGASAGSAADAFYMPALGWAAHSGRWSYGFGLFGQGGMGTELGADSFMANPGQMATSPNLVNRSEVSVGRAMAPLVFAVNSKLHIGGTVDFVWAGMDLRMAMSEAQFQDLANPASRQAGSASGSMVDSFGALYEPFGGSGINTLHHAYFDFNNDNGFSGKARGYGLGGKLGLTYEVSPQLTVGATYHAKTWLNDLRTNEAQLSMAVNGDTGILAGAAASGTDADITIGLGGDITVKNFQWPAMSGIGLALRPASEWLLVADYKRIHWAGVMANFNMVFTAANVASNGGFAGKALDATLYQNWEDQDVIALGAAYQLTPAWTLRAGANFGDNPIPDRYLNALFPAIIEKHYTAGAGYQFSASSAINAAVSVAPESRVTAASGITSEHSQLSWQLLYSHLWP
jgi:long-chain fatty acid transport protein